MRDDQINDTRRFVEVRSTDSQGQRHDRQVPTDTQELRLEFEDIQSIDLSSLSSCRSLQTIHLWSNRLRSIDLSPLSSCSSLKIIDLHNNQLQSIDLTPLSSCSSLQALSLSTNQLQAIDLSPLSSCDSLEKFNLDHNQLQRIDLSPLSSCSGLRTLNLIGNKLQSILLLSCSSLQTLRLEFNPLESIDLSPLSSCGNLQYLNLWHNKLQTIDLTPVMFSKNLEQIYFGSSAVSISLLSRETCEGLWSRKRLHPQSVSVCDSLHELPTVTALRSYHPLVREYEPRWKSHHLLHCLLSMLGLGWVGLLDTDPVPILDEALGQQGTPRVTDSLSSRVMNILREQIDRGGTTVGLDVEQMAKNGEMGSRVQRVFDLRCAEMESAGFRIDADGTADLHALWLTAHGHSVLSAMRLGTKSNAVELKQVKGALGKMGFSLTMAEEKLAMPTNISEPLWEYIWRLADFRAKERTKKT